MVVTPHIQDTSSLPTAYSNKYIKPKIHVKPHKHTAAFTYTFTYEVF